MLRFSFKLIATLCTWAFFLNSSTVLGEKTPPKNTNKSEDEINLKIKAIMSDYQAVGLSFAVVKDGKIVYSQALGSKNIENASPLKTEHIFRIASISKSFAATAIMQLVEKGKVSLEDDMSKLIGFKVRNPKFPEKIITLKMLLSHTSSISDKEGYFKLDVIHPMKGENWENCYNDYEPGSEYQYCNLNYNMIGAVVEKLTGQRYDSYIQSHILGPLHLYGGYCVDSLDASKFASIYELSKSTQIFKEQPDAYHPRREELKNYILGETTPVFSPTGGMKISAEDLAKYMIMHMNYGEMNGQRIISEKSSKIMQTPVLETSQYGLALNVKQNYIPGETMIGHTGSAYGLYSNMYFEPNKKFGFVIITNGCRADQKSGFTDVLQKTALVLHEHFILSGQ